MSWHPKLNEKNAFHLCQVYECYQFFIIYIERMLCPLNEMYKVATKVCEKLQYVYC